jgi:hypothetical protein
MGCPEAVAWWLEFLPDSIKPPEGDGLTAVNVR